MILEEFMIKVDRFYHDNEPKMRYGQTIMNMLYQVWPDWYNKITGTDLDCFYDDGIVRFTLEYLKKEWDDTNI